MARASLWLILLTILAWRGWAGEKEFTLTDYLRHDWRDEVVRFGVEFAPGECDGKNLALAQVWDGQRVPCQLIEVARHPDGSVQRARLVFIADLPARQSRTWRLGFGGAAEPAPPASQLSAVQDGEYLVLSSGTIAVRVPFGQRRYRAPVPAAQAPAPLLGVKGPDGQWRGKGWLESSLAVVGCETTLLEDGPVLKECRVAYQFAGDKSYRVTVHLYNRLNYAHVVEEANVDKASAFVFSAYAGFAPTHWMPAERAAEPLEYREDRRLLRFFFNTYFHQVFDLKDWVGVFREDAASKDYLAFVKVNGGDWTSPLHNAIHFLECKDPDLRLRATLRPCRREWLVAMYDRTKAGDMRGSHDHPGPLELLCARVGFLPLDEVKEMVLSWPLKTPPAPPPSHSGEGERGKDARERTLEDRRITESLINCWGGNAHSALTNGLYLNVGAMTYGYAKGAAREYGRVAGTGVLSPDDERYVRASMALMAYAGMNRDFFAWYFPLLPREDTSDAEEPLQNWRYNFYMMNTNFDANRFTGIAEIALSLRDHPDFDKFIAHYKQCLRLHLDNTFSEDGYYHEDTSYYCYDMFLLATTIDRMKREFGLDSLDEPRFKKGLWCVVKLMTPPDPRYGGARTLPPFGDHDPTIGLRRGWSQVLFARMAEDYAQRDQELAGALSWAWQQVGLKETGPNVAPKVPELHSERIRGWGAVLRSRMGTERESYVLFRCEPFVGRYLNIENCFQYHAKGAPLIITPQGAGFVDDEPYGSLGRNKIGFNGTGVYEHWWGQLGVLEEFQALDTCDYVRGYVHSDAYQRKGMLWSESYRDKPHAHRRHLLSVHGDYLVLTDEVQCDYPSDFTLNVLADRVEQRGNSACFTGRFDVDLDVHFLTPPSHIETKEAVMKVGENYAKREAVLWLHADAPPNQTWLTVLAPFIRGTEAAPEVQRLGDTFGARVTQQGNTDYVFLSPTEMRWQEGSLRFEGTRGVLRSKPRVELALLDAGIISAEKVTLASTAGGISLAVCAAGGWQGQSHGGEKVLVLGGVPLREAQLDGQPLPWEATPEGAKFSIPEGRHEVRMR